MKAVSACQYQEMLFEVTVEDISPTRNFVPMGHARPVDLRLENYCGI